MQYGRSYLSPFFGHADSLQLGMLLDLDELHIKASEVSPH